MFLVAPAAFGAQVRGTVDLPLVQPSLRTLGYTRTRVAAPAKSAVVRRQDVAVFLKEKESLPISAPTEPFKVAVKGLRLVPSVAACVVDGKVSFENEEKWPLTILVDQKPVAELKPGESKTYDCSTADPNLRRIQVKEWPHVRGSLFVGEVGVVAQVNGNGGFSLQAPQGKYELQIVGLEGLITKQDVEIVKADLDVGRVLASGPAGSRAATPAPEVMPKPGGPAKRPPVQPKKKPSERPIDTPLQFENEGSEP